jgi:phosphoesterase RecJ-like protein
MPIDWKPFVEFVRRHRRFLLTTHVRPDGDGLGSMLALTEALEAIGKEARLVVASTYPPRYAFLDPGRRVGYFEPPGEQYRDAEAVVVLDTGTWNQLGSFGNFLRGLEVEKAVIDHHVTQDEMAGLCLVDTTAEATGRLARDAVGALGVPLSPRMASNLFVAVAMDTGWFRHSNTTPATFALASELVAAGARPEELYEELFERNSLARLRLVGLVLERLTVVSGGLVAYTELRRGDYEATGATPQDSEDLVNYTRSMHGVAVGLFFLEQPRGGVKVSFRSRGAVDVARLAESFGGGGHRQASGAVLPTASLAEARARVLEAVAAVLAPAS